MKLSSFIHQLLEDYRMTDAKPAVTPVEVEKTIEQSKSYENFPYRELLGSLQYMANKNRPDISYGVNKCARHTENPLNYDLSTIKRIVRYLKGSKDKGLRYAGDTTIMKLMAFSDSDYAGDKETRRSITDYIISYCGGLVSWCTRKQPIVALSMMEVEYISAAECTNELLYQNSAGEELLDDKFEVTLCVDNQSAIKLTENGVVNRRLKPIDVRHQFIYEKVHGNDFILYCPTDEQLADLFTKSLKTSKVCV